MKNSLKFHPAPDFFKNFSVGQYPTMPERHALIRKWHRRKHHFSQHRWGGCLYLEGRREGERQRALQDHHPHCKNNPRSSGLLRLGLHRDVCSICLTCQDQDSSLGQHFNTKHSILVQSPETAWQCWILTAGCWCGFPTPMLSNLCGAPPAGRVRQLNHPYPSILVQPKNS